MSTPRVDEQGRERRRCSDCGEFHSTSAAALRCDHNLGLHMERVIGCPECDLGNWGMR